MAEEVKREEKPKKRLGLWLLGGWALLLLLAGLIGCFLFYQYLGIYEVTRPEARMDELMELMSAEDWLNKAGENLDFTVSEYEDAEALYAAYRESLTTTEPLSYRSEKSGSDSEHAIFYVRSGPSNLARVELTSSEQRLPFGRHAWRLTRISTGDVTKNLRSATVEVTAFQSQEIRLNGKILGEDCLSESGVKLEKLSAIEQRMDEVPQLVRYKVAPLYGELHVTADGRELPAARQGKTLRYSAVTEPVGTLTVFAPADFRVTVGGAELKRSDVSESGYALLEGLESYTGSEAYKTNVYRFTGLYTAPEVLAYDKSGKALTPIMSGESVYHFFYPSDEAADEAEQKELEHLWELAEGYFGAYVDYTTKPFDGYIYNKLVNATLVGTQLRAYIAQSTATMQWAASSTVENRELHVDNLHRVGEHCYTCTVQFALDKTASTWAEEVSSTEQNAEQLVFVNVGPYWYAAAMAVLGD